MRREITFGYVNYVKHLTGMGRGEWNSVYNNSANAPFDI